MDKKVIQTAAAKSFLNVLEKVTDPQSRIEVVISALFEDVESVKINPTCHFVLNGNNGNNGLIVRMIGSRNDLMAMFCTAIFQSNEMILQLMKDSIEAYEEAKQVGIFNKN